MEISTPELRFRDYLRFVGGVKEDERVTLVIQFLYLLDDTPYPRVGRF
jgi:hypothetical protein